MMRLHDAARLYGVELVEYGGERRQGTLVCSGAGLMLAIMDAAPLRYCVEADTAERRPGCRLDDFLVCAARLAPPVAVAGWFSLSQPDVLRRGIEAAGVDGECVYAGGGTAVLHPAQHVTLDAFLRALVRQFGELESRPFERLHGEI